MSEVNNAVIVNLTAQSWNLHRSYGTYLVRGCRNEGCTNEGGRVESGANEEPYTLTTVGARKASMDVGDKRTFEVNITAQEVAHDLCREINADGGEDSFFGVFVAAGDVPTEDELAQARQRLAVFYRHLVAVADREWERSHSYLFIDDVERRAAQYLGLEKEWFYQPRESAECPGCGEKIKPGVAVCKTCRAILDPAKAALLGLVPATSTAASAASTAAAKFTTTAVSAEAGKNVPAIQRR